MWNSIVSVPDHCLFIYFSSLFAGADNLKRFDRNPIPLDCALSALMAIMALRQHIRNRRRSVGSCQYSGFVRFQYASSTLLIRSCYAGHDAAAVLLRFCCAWGPTRRLPRRFYCAATTAKDFKLRLICDYDDAIAIVLRPKCRSCADTALMLLRLCCALEPLLYKSAGNPGSAAVDHQPSNKMDDRIVPVAMMQVAVMNQRQARRTNPGGGGPKGSGSVLGCRQTEGSNLDILEGACLA